MGPHDRSRMTNIVMSVFLSLVFLSLLINGTGMAYAAEQGSGKTAAGPAQHSDLGQSIDKTLKAEEDNLRQLQEQLKQVQALKETVGRELDAYNLQMSVHGNLLLLPTTAISDLQKARTDQQLTLETIATRLKKLTEKRDTIGEVQRQTEEKYTLNEKQLTEIKAEGSKDALAKTRLGQFDTLLQLISRERKIIDEIRGGYTNLITQLQEIQQALSGLTKRFDEEIRDRKKQDLFKRKESPFASLGWTSITDELSLLAGQVASLVTVDFWLKKGQAVWPSGGFALVMFLLLFGIFYFLFLRLRQYCLLVGQRPVMSSRPWGSLTLKLIERSSPLLGATVFLYTYAQVRLVYSSVPLVRLVVHLLLIWLFFRWELDLLKLWPKGDKPPGSKPLIFRLRVLIVATRAFAIAYVILAWMIGEDGAILFLCRAFFEVAFLVWSISFWRIFRQISPQFSPKKSRLFLNATPLIVGLGYAIAGGGLLLELAGYGPLALYWFMSWGRTLVVLSWAGLLFFSLREWNATLAKAPDADERGDTERARPMKWLLIRLSSLAWMGTLLVCLVLAWGGTQTIFVSLLGVLHRPIQLGGMRLSLAGFIYATLILFVTHAAARLWRQFLRQQILYDSGLELGVQESITTVTVYLLWGLGILVSLNVMGLSTTSIAVAFGALSIGLGFGLQNIFNNFVSGLILLFERPVQVGDVVQVNEIWGTITKINVRSTVVQTYDNASLIIPNSDMISNQVTNWSFKDLRLRRNIVVGVAYGSNTELVRETLLEIAQGHPKVLKRPKPDVLFDDFGDSALIFRLRLWTTIEHFIAMETDVRFEIDRLFRERNIEIAFPQRDIHIRSVVGKTQLELNSEG